MPNIQIFDPALCCSTGVCGVEVCKTACKTFQISGVISVQKLPPWVV